MLLGLRYGMAIEYLIWRENMAKKIKDTSETYVEIDPEEVEYVLDAKEGGILSNSPIKVFPSTVLKNECVIIDKDSMKFLEMLFKKISKGETSLEEAKKQLEKHLKNNPNKWLLLKNMGNSEK